MQAGKPLIRVVLVATALAGCAISYLLLTMTTEGSFASGLCSPRPGVNCADVLNSPWGRIGAIPVSLFGLFYFAVFALWYGSIGLPNHGGRVWHIAVLVINLASLVFSVRLVLVMKLELHTWCEWCLYAHATNLAMFILGLFGYPRRPSSDAAAPAAPYPTPRRVAEILLPGLFGCALGFAGITFALQQNFVAQVYRARYNEIVENPEYVAWQHSREARVNIATHGDEVAWGDANAPHTVIVFSDFQCPRCRELDAFIPKVVERYPKLIRFVFKHYPLCNECNKAFPDSFGCQHKYACKPAFAAEAVRRAGGAAAAMKYHDLLFQNSHRLAALDLVELATQVGVPAAAFQAALADPATSKRIQDDTMLGKSLAVEGSADVYLDGQRLRNWRLMDRKNPKQMHIEASLRLWGRVLGVLPPSTAPLTATRPAS